MSCVTPWEPPPEGSWALSSSSEGSGLPSLMPSPPCGLTAYFLCRLSLVGSHGKSAWAAAMIAVLHLHLGIHYGPCKVHHELFHNPVNTIRVLNFHFSSLLVLSPSKCARHMATVLDAGWFPLSIHKGKKLIVFGLVGLSTIWLHGFQNNSMDSSFSASLAA